MTAPAPTTVGRALAAVGRALAVVATTVVTGALLVGSGRWFGMGGPAFAFAALWLTMCGFTVVSWAWPLRLPLGWFELRPFERDGRVYRKLGVTVFKRLLRRGPIALFNPGLKLPATRDGPGLERLDRTMRTAETNHTWLFAIGLGLAGHGTVRGWWGAAAWTMAFNLVINAYPVMLQRYNRGRLCILRTRRAGPGSRP